MIRIRFYRIEIIRPASHYEQLVRIPDILEIMLIFFRTPAKDMRIAPLRDLPVKRLDKYQDRFHSVQTNKRSIRGSRKERKERKAFAKYAKRLHKKLRRMRFAFILTCYMYHFPPPRSKMIGEMSERRQCCQRASAHI